MAWNGIPHRKGHVLDSSFEAILLCCVTPVTNIHNLFVTKHIIKSRDILYSKIILRIFIAPINQKVAVIFSTNALTSTADAPGNHSGNH
jgi:hypothetical protein